VYPQQPDFRPPGHWQRPPVRRSRKDIWATVLLSAGQLAASTVAAVTLAGLVLWLMMPICSDDCDSPQINHFVHQTLTAVAVIGGGVIVALLLAGIGITVAAVRRATMWIWPAAGLVIVVVTYAVSAVLWMDGLPGGR
jgi:hypothetical protein